MTAASPVAAAAAVADRGLAAVVPIAEKVAQATTAVSDCGYSERQRTLLPEVRLAG